MSSKVVGVTRLVKFFAEDVRPLAFDGLLRRLQGLQLTPLNGKFSSYYTTALAYIHTLLWGMKGIERVFPDNIVRRQF